MARTVDRVAGGTTKGVVVARQVEVVLPLVGAVANDVVGVEVRDDARRRRGGQVADAVVRHADGRGDTVVVIFGAREITGVVVGVVGDDATRPGAAREPAVGRVRIRRAAPVRVDLVRDEARGRVKEPARRVAVCERLVSVGRHRDPAAIGVVGVVDGIRRAAHGDDAPLRVVGGHHRVRERIGDGRPPSKRVMAVGRRRPQRIDRPRDAPLRVVDGLSPAAASVDLRDLPAKRVVLVRRRHARLGARGNHESGARDSDGGKRRAGHVRRARHRVRRAVKAGAHDGRVSARVEGLHLGDEDAARFVRRAKAGEPRARRGNARQRGRAVGTGLPGRRLAPPVAVEKNVPHVVRDDAVRVVPVDLTVEVHVGDGQGSLFLLIAFSSRQP